MRIRVGLRELRSSGAIRGLSSKAAPACGWTACRPNRMDIGDANPYKGDSPDCESVGFHLRRRPGAWGFMREDVSAHFSFLVEQADGVQHAEHGDAAVREDRQPHGRVSG